MKTELTVMKDTRVELSLSCSESCPGADGIPAWEWHFLDLFASGQDTRVAPFNGCLIQAIGNSLGHLTGEFLLLLRKRNQGGFCHPLIVFSTDKSGLSSVKGCHKPISNICYLLSPCSVAVDHDWLIGLHTYDSPNIHFGLEICFVTDLNNHLTQHTWQYFAQLILWSGSWTMYMDGFIDRAPSK